MVVLIEKLIACTKNTWQVKFATKPTKAAHEMVSPPINFAWPIIYLLPVSYLIKVQWKLK